MRRSAACCGARLKGHVGGGNGSNGSCAVCGIACSRCGQGVGRLAEARVLFCWPGVAVKGGRKGDVERGRGKGEHRDHGFARLVCRLANVPGRLGSTGGVGVARVVLNADTVLVNQGILAVVTRGVDVAGGVAVLAVAGVVDLVRVRVTITVGVGIRVMG